MANSAKTSGSFQRRLTVGFVTTMAFMAVIAIASTFLLRDVINNKDTVIYDYGQDLILTERLRYLAEKKISLFRGFFIHHNPVFLEEIPDVKKQFATIIEQLMRTASPVEVQDLVDLKKLSADYDEANENIVSRIQRGENAKQIVTEITQQVRPFRKAFEEKISELAEIESHELEVAKAASIQKMRRSFILIAIISSLALGLAATLAFVLGRTLTGIYRSALRATRLREEMLGIVAHDLKNPIAAIRMSANLIKRKIAMAKSGKDDLKLSPIMDRIDRVTQQMQSLIEDLLIADKIESGIFVPDLKSEDLSKLVADIVDSTKPLAEDGQIRFVTEIPPQLGTIRCDRGRLMQVFSNLLGNAIKFTPNEGTVSFEVKPFENKICFVVRDTGPGIPSHQLPYLFDRRWQAHAKEKGNGLGLYIAKNIIDAHRGRITAKSNPGHDTLFEVEIPREI